MNKKPLKLKNRVWGDGLVCKVFALLAHEYEFSPQNPGKEAWHCSVNL